MNAAGAADADDPRLAPLTAVALDLPEAKRERGDRRRRLHDEAGDLVVGDLAGIEAQPDPAAVADVGRAVEAVGLLVDQRLGDRHATFRVRGRAFAYLLVDHHGDGIVGLVVKAPPAVAESLIDEEPDRFYRPAYVGHRGWVGLRLDAGEVDDDQVTGLVVESYRLCAPKSLARAIT